MSFTLADAPLTRASLFGRLARVLLQNISTDALMDTIEDPLALKEIEKRVRRRPEQQEGDIVYAGELDPITAADATPPGEETKTTATERKYM